MMVKIANVTFHWPLSSLHVGDKCRAHHVKNVGLAEPLLHLVA